MRYTKFLIRGGLIGSFLVLVSVYAEPFGQLEGSVRGFLESLNTSSLTAQLQVNGDSSSSASSLPGIAPANPPVDNADQPFVKTGNPGSISECDGYESLFPSDGDVPDGQTRMHVWAEIFSTTIDRITQHALTVSPDAENCRAELHKATTEVVRTVQLYECAIVREANNAPAAAASVLLGASGDDELGQEDGDTAVGDDPGGIPIMDLFEYMNKEEELMRKALNVSQNTLKFVLGSPAFRCEGGSQRNASSDASSSRSAAPVDTINPFQDFPDNAGGQEPPTETNPFLNPSNEFGEPSIPANDQNPGDAFFGN